MVRRRQTSNRKNSDVADAWRRLAPIGLIWKKFAWLPWSAVPTPAIDAAQPHPGQKVSIVFAKPQTTRNRIVGILNEPRGQIAFLDTPGIHKPLHKMNVR